MAIHETHQQAGDALTAPDCSGFPRKQPSIIGKGYHSEERPGLYISLYITGDRQPALSGGGGPDDNFASAYYRCRWRPAMADKNFMTAGNYNGLNDKRIEHARMLISPGMSPQSPLVESALDDGQKRLFRAVPQDGGEDRSMGELFHSMW